LKRKLEIWIVSSFTLLLSLISLTFAVADSSIKGRPLIYGEIIEKRSNVAGIIWCVVIEHNEVLSAGVELAPPISQDNFGVACSQIIKAATKVFADEDLTLNDLHITLRDGVGYPIQTWITFDLYSGFLSFYTGREPRFTDIDKMLGAERDVLGDDFVETADREDSSSAITANSLTANTYLFSLNSVGENMGLQIDKESITVLDVNDENEIFFFYGELEITLSTYGNSNEIKLISFPVDYDDISAESLGALCAILKKSLPIAVFRAITDFDDVLSTLMPVLTTLQSGNVYEAYGFTFSTIIREYRSVILLARPLY